MAHELMYENGRHAMFCVGDRKAAWHELGQRTPDAVAWQEAMRLAGLDWTVEKRQLCVAGAEGKPYPVAAWGIFRRNGNGGKFLGTVGEQYEPIQNEKQFAWVDALLEAENGAHYESAGALGNGERVWCLARVPGADFAPVEGDQHQSFLLFASSHDGSLSATCKLTTVRVVCQNTLTQALAHANHGTSFKIRHTVNAGKRMDAALRMMQGVVRDARDLENKLRALAERKLTRESMTGILDRLFPKPKDEEASQTRRENVLADVLKLYEINVGGYAAGTAYNLLNAVTEWTDYLRGVRITDKRANLTEQQVRAENALFGTGETFKASALDTILQMTGGTPNLLDSVIARHN